MTRIVIITISALALTTLLAYAHGGNKEQKP